MSDQEIFYPEGINVAIASKSFNIKPFVVKNRLKFAKIVGDVMAKIASSAGLSVIDPKNATSMIPAFIEVAADKLPEIYELVLNKDRAWIDDNVTIENEFDIIKAIIEVNKIPLIWGQIQKLTEKKKSS